MAWPGRKAAAWRAESRSLRWEVKVALAAFLVVVDGSVHRSRSLFSRRRLSYDVPRLCDLTSTPFHLLLSPSPSLLLPLHILSLSSTSILKPPSQLLSANFVVDSTSSLPVTPYHSSLSPRLGLATQSRQAHLSDLFPTSRPVLWSTTARPASVRLGCRFSTPTTHHSDPASFPGVDPAASTLTASIPDSRGAAVFRARGSNNIPSQTTAKPRQHRLYQIPSKSACSWCLSVGKTWFRLRAYLSSVSHLHPKRPTRSRHVTRR
jgi:hypothetical protein